jgi:hypothetical protein
MIGETIIALIAALVIVVWVLVMAVAETNRRLHRLETIVCRIHGYSDPDDAEVTP